MVAGPGKEAQQVGLTGQRLGAVSEEPTIGQRRSGTGWEARERLGHGPINYSLYVTG
jgi:hypothetical protein